MSKPVAWSYSSLTSFEGCPHRWAEVRIFKRITEPQTEHTLWGNRVHKAFEDRIGRGAPFTKELEQYGPIAARIAEKAKGCTVATEQKIAMTKDFKETAYFAKDVWLRTILDLSIEKGTRAVIIDYKTGKKNPDSAQLQLSAATYFATRPWIDRITNTFLWLQSGETTTETFERDDAHKIWQDFIPRVSRLEQAVELQKFPKRPSGLCRAWCPVHTCEHNGKYTGK